MSDQDELWHFFDARRAARNAIVHRRSMTPDEFVIIGPVSERKKQLCEILNKECFSDHPDPYFQSPKLLVDFVARYAKHLKPNSILDPVCGYGMLLAGSAESAGAEVVHGVDINEKAVEIASAIAGDSAKILNGDCLVSRGELLQKYDFIVADPPLGVRLSREQSEAIGLQTQLLEQAVLSLTASRLSDHGVGLVVVSPGFFFFNPGRRSCPSLDELGCRISAALHIPSGSRIHTGMSSYLLVLERGQQEDLFVGQLNQEPEHQDQLVSNMIRRKPKGDTSLGRLCALNKFKGFKTFVDQEALSRIAVKIGWTAYSFEKVFTHCERVHEDQDPALEEDAYSLYLKILGEVRASTHIDDLPSRVSKKIEVPRLLHLKVDPESADPNFMEYWFNETQVGQLTISSIRGDRHQFSQRELKSSKIYLPDLQEQKLIVQSTSYLGKVRAEIAELEDSLRSGSESVTELFERIQTINQEDRYEDWLESLPFPLASILWRQHASKGSAHLQYKILLQFFEALAAFLATVHLSAFMAEEEIWDKYGDGLKRKLIENKLSLDHATFGSWKLTFEYLSGKCSSLLQDADEHGSDQTWTSIFRSTDRKFVEMLSHKNLRKILQRANKIRNDWDGHSGAIGEASSKEILRQLVELVQEVRAVFGRSWQRYELIQPGLARYQDGLHSVTSKRLVGTRSSPFEERVYQSKDPLEFGQLYLFDSVAQRGLPLLSFIQVMPSPEQQAFACYIYSRVTDDQARFVSYHFEQESEIHHHTEGIQSALEKLDLSESMDA